MHRFGWINSVTDWHSFWAQLIYVASKRSRFLCISTGPYTYIGLHTCLISVSFFTVSRLQYCLLNRALNTTQCIQLMGHFLNAFKSLFHKFRKITRTVACDSHAWKVMPPVVCLLIMYVKLGPTIKKHIT